MFETIFIKKLKAELFGWIGEREKLLAYMFIFSLEPVAV